MVVPISRCWVPLSSEIGFVVLFALWPWVGVASNGTEYLNLLLPSFVPVFFGMVVPLGVVLCGCTVGLLVLGWLRRGVPPIGCFALQMLEPIMYCDLLSPSFMRAPLPRFALAQRFSLRRWACCASASLMPVGASPPLIPIHPSVTHNVLSSRRLSRKSDITLGSGTSTSFGILARHMSCV